MASRLQACKVYISEGRRARVIQQLTEAASSVPHARLADVFVDAPYNRTNFLLTSASPDRLVGAATALSRAALALLDLSAHDASHPRLGIVDHISCQPVGPAATLQQAGMVARAIGEGLQAHVPVLLYGAAHSQQRMLADIRRQLGYFKGAREGQWGVQQGTPTHCFPDYGPSYIDPRAGVAAVGATPWVTNLNIPLASNDLAAARRVAKLVSARGGGLPAVEAMALPHSGGTEVACNLLDTALSSVEAVTRAVQRFAAEAGLPLGAEAYVLGATREQLLADGDGDGS